MASFNDPDIDPLSWDAFNGKLQAPNGPYCDSWNKEDHLSRLVESVLRGDDAFNRSVQENCASLQDLAALTEPTPIKEPIMYPPLESYRMFSPVQQVQHTAHQLEQHTHRLLQGRQVQEGSANSDETLEEPSIEKPKKSLTAYNLFFQAERKRLLMSLPSPQANGKKKPRHSHGKIGFAEMARIVSMRWRQISAEEKKAYEHMARLDKQRYLQEMEAYSQYLVAASCLTKKYNSNGEATFVNTTIHETSNR